MASCEMCGNKVNKTILTNIAGSKMKVCSSCASYGKKIYDDNNKTHKFYLKKRNISSNEEIVPNFSSLIQKELSKKKLTPHHLAKAVNIKYSLISQYLSGKIKPEIKDAKKIENFLEINLIENFNKKIKKENLINEQDVELDNIYEENNKENLTLGELIAKKMKNGH